MFSTRKKDMLFLFLFSLLSLLPLLAIREADIMEARNFITAREMIQDGAWWITKMNGELRFAKPPFPSWLTAICMYFSKNTWNEAILRLPNTFFISFFVLYFYKKMEDIFQNRRLAFFTNLILLTSFFFLKTATENTWDIYVYPLSFLAGLCIYQYVSEEKRKYLWELGLWTSLSVLSKGPVGIYGVLIPSLLSSLLLNKEHRMRKFSWIALSILLAFALGSLWYFSIYLHYPKEFLQILSQEKQSWSEKHHRSFFYYLDYFFYTGIWLFFALASVFHPWKKLEKKERFFQLWHLMMLLAISLVGMKKKRYALALYLSLAPMIATYISRFWEENLIPSKLENFLWQVQKYFLGLLAIFSLLLLAYLQIKYSYFSTGVFLLGAFLFSSLGYCIFYGKFGILQEKKTIFFFSIFLFFMSNLYLNGAIDKTFLSFKDKIRHYQLSQENSFPIYAREFEIEDVWRVGRKIKKFPKEPKEETFFYLKNSKSDDTINRFEIIKQEENLYLLRRKL